ncbi:myeloid cell surface antigen CD33 [Sigmodon hispidus]
MLLTQLLPLLWLNVSASGDSFVLPAKSMVTNKPYRLELQSTIVTVQEGLCVQVPCSCFYSSNSSSDTVFGYWFHAGANIEFESPVATNNPNRQPIQQTRSHFHLSGDPKNNKCSLDIRDAQRSDSGSYFFRLENGDEKWTYQEKLSVHVTALTHTPNIDIPQTLELGHSSNVICSVPWACDQGTPPIFSWMSAAITILGPRTTLSSVLTLTPRLQDHGTNLICQVTFPGADVTVQKTVRINVTWKSEPVAEVVLVAMAEAAIKFLLLGMCLTFLIMKPQRKNVEKPATQVDYADIDMD